MELSFSVCKLIPPAGKPDPVKLIFMVPLSVPSTMAPRDSENT